MDPVVQILLEKIGTKITSQQSYDYKQDLLLLRAQVTLHCSATLVPHAGEENSDKAEAELKIKLASYLVELVDECKTEARRRRDGR